MNTKSTINAKNLNRLLTLLALLLAAPAMLHAQGYSGFYYLQNRQDGNHYYLVPAAGTGTVRYYKNNAETPYLTTYQMSKESNTDNFIWYLEQVSDGGQTYYRFRHMLTGRYIVMNDVEDANNPVRRRLHLESMQVPDDNARFLIDENSGHTQMGIRHATLSATNTDGKVYWWWDMSDGNQNNYSQGDYKGLLGLWVLLTGSENDRMKWLTPEPVTAEVCLPPDISYDASTQTVTISSHEGFGDVDFYYTTDGTDPTPSSNHYAGSFPLASGTVKAIAVRGTFQNPTVSTLNTAQCALPTIAFNDGVYTFTSTPGATFYYTTDGTLPTTSSTPCAGTLSDLPLDLTRQFLRVIAAKEADGSDASPAALYNIPKCENPTITNSDGTINMACTTTGAEIRYREGNNGIAPTSGTQYTAPYDKPLATASHTIYARAFKSGYRQSDVVSLVYPKLETPAITSVALDGTVTLSPAGATFRFTTSTSTPPPDPGYGQSELEPGSTILLPAGTTTQIVKIRAYKAGNGYSDVLTYYVPVCDAPVIQLTGSTVSITSTIPGAIIYYSTSRTGDFSVYDGTPFTKTDVVRAYASCAGRQNSPVAILQDAVEVNSTDDITDMSGSYKLSANFTVNGSIGTSSDPFTGTIDGQLNTIGGTTYPLVAYADNATICNVIVYNATISASGNVGAIVCNATGQTRIYNCGVLGGTVASTDAYCGGIAGQIDDYARVINCYSYADITGGTTVGGIVGYNSVATTSAFLRTMVFNCMFYGDIDATRTTNRAPVYNGQIITNRGDQSGVSNYNFCRAEAPYVTNRQITTANCALLAETRFLQRFEFFRHLLNGHRELAAWWISGNAVDTALVAKWVMLPDSIGTTHPYPILKRWGKYPSVVNIDAANAQEDQPRNKGGKLGTLTVHIQMGSGGAQFAPPTGASISMANANNDTTLIITDKDPDHFNFNYYKVQLPYYNEVGTHNYNDYRVVTGWKIVSITVNGTPTTEGTGTFSTGDDYPAYNFADRSSTKKDLYSVSGRVFNQGAYWDVPEGVTAITIEPYWAKASYVADDYRDKVYNQNMGTVYLVTTVGGGHVFSDNTNMTINGQDQIVRSSIGNALTSLHNNADDSAHTVYDYAIVLVGNLHNIGVSSDNKKFPYTIMSADFDCDNEPDYSYILRFNGRLECHPVRVDFLNMPGLGMAQKSTGGSGSYNFGILLPNSWFESTNTSLFRVTQFEYDRTNRAEAPLILQGGVIEQWVSGQEKGYSNNTTYFHVGGNVWFYEFHRGTHQDQTYLSKHPPISVTGGDYEQFYLTGLYRGDVDNYDDNAECYINGGRFGILAGTGQEGIGTSADKGNITWQIQNADIDEFYGGGINAAKPAIGNITTTITNSHVGLFCGGPKFGDMSSGKTVTTTATNCTFGNYFGAGYGGNSYSREAPKNYSGQINIDWNKWIRDNYKQEYKEGYGGVSTQLNYQFIPLSGNESNVERIFVEYVKFSLAVCHNVTSTLTGCTVTGNFYGGGSLGKVVGPVSSTLTDCNVLGNVFGAGFSASLPTVEVDSIGFRLEPYYYTDFGTFRTGVWGSTTTYTWQHRDAVSSTATGIDKTNHILYTTEDLGTLGTVGDAVLFLKGTTTVAGNVFGGGDQSGVIITGTATGSCQVFLRDDAHVGGNVFGGGNQGAVAGPSSVTIQNE